VKGAKVASLVPDRPHGTFRSDGLARQGARLRCLSRQRPLDGGMFLSLAPLYCPYTDT